MGFPGRQGDPRVLAGSTTGYIASPRETDSHRHLTSPKISQAYSKSRTIMSIDNTPKKLSESRPVSPTSTLNVSTDTQPNKKALPDGNDPAGAGTRPDSPASTRSSATLVDTSDVPGLSTLRKHLLLATFATVNHPSWCHRLKPGSRHPSSSR